MVRPDLKPHELLFLIRLKIPLGIKRAPICEFSIRGEPLVYLVVVDKCFYVNLTSGLPMDRSIMSLMLIIAVSATKTK